MNGRRVPRAVRVVLAAAVALAAAPAGAGVCWFQSVSGVAFGNYDVFSSAPTDSSGQVRVACLLWGNLQVSLDRGSSPTFRPRTMRSGASVLQYNLYRDAARSQVWGDGTEGTSTYEAQYGLIQAFTLNVYGRIPARQDAAVGSYQDTITVTINY